jgi:D-alanyl-D-alanine carboxypeptidase
VTHRFTLAVIVVLQLATINAQPARPVAAADAVDKYVTAELTRRHIPGVALAIVRGGKVVKAQGYGKADLEHEIPVTPETVFKIGSVSKQFLATGIMLLAQDGRLSVDDPVGKHIDGVPESWRGITLRHFLTHTSGVVREGPAFDASRVQPDIDVIRSAFAAPLEFPTGSKYQYCNVCYFSLAEVIARVSGKPWDVFLTERVFAPTGMSATRTTTTTALVPRRARGYVWRNDQYQNAAELLALRPSGAFLSTVLDLAKWDAALYQDRILTKASRDAMWKAMPLTDGGMSQYGFGWQLSAVACTTAARSRDSAPKWRGFRMIT